jgi:hypothetical protein
MEAFVKKYTKLFLATLCFISSAPVLADGYKGEAPPLVPVTIPNFNGGFEFTIGAIYMQPTSSNLTYLGVNTTTTVTGTPSFTGSTWNESSINPGYDWGFVLGLGYVFPNTANDVKLDWMYFHNNYSNSTNYGIPLTLVNTDADAVIFPLDTQDLDPGELFHASAKMEYDFDAVDLTFGQYVNIGPRLQTRLFAGLRYMRLNSDLSTSTAFTQTDAGTGEITGFNYTNGSLNSSFNGLGPLFGIKADYYLGMGFGISGAFDAALLVGDLSFSGNQRQLSTDEDFVVTGRTVNDLNWDSQNTVSPAFDGKFGLNYKYQFNNGTLVALELGYQVTKYIDVVEQMDRGGTDATYFDTDVTNFGLNGPYLTLNVKV